MPDSSPFYTLMTPGPVPVPPEILESLGAPMEHHRTPEFEATFARVKIGLQKVFATSQPVFLHTSTGSGAMESALVNTLSPGDKVLCIVSGKFGERWAEMAETFGYVVTRLNVPWGESVDLTQIQNTLNVQPDFKAILCQVCETSTGALHDVLAIAKLTATRPQTLLIVDAITAMGALPLPMDESGIDVIIAGSQKAFMLPTGLAFISLSEKAWKAAEGAKTPRYYFDLRKEKAANEKGETFFSSAVTHIRALDLILRLEMQDGLNQIIQRIQKLSRATRAAVEAMDLQIFPKNPSPSLSVISMPDGVNSQKVRDLMESQFHITVMGGQDQLKGKVIRIGHMGYITNQDMMETIKALADCINLVVPETISSRHILAAQAALHQELAAPCECKTRCFGCQASDD